LIILEQPSSLKVFLELMTCSLPQMTISSKSASRRLKFDAYATSCNPALKLEASLPAAAVLVAASSIKAMLVSAGAAALAAVATSIMMAAVPQQRHQQWCQKIALQTQRSATRGLHPPWREEAGLTVAWSGHPA
jgi:hypothetical protein